MEKVRGQGAGSFLWRGARKFQEAFKVQLSTRFQFLDCRVRKKRLTSHIASAASTAQACLAPAQTFLNLFHMLLPSVHLLGLSILVTLSSACPLPSLHPSCPLVWACRASLK